MERLPGSIRVGWQSGTAGASRRDRASCGLEEQAKIFRHVPSGGVPVGRSFRHRFQADAFEFLGDRVVDLPRRASFSVGSLAR